MVYIGAIIIGVLSSMLGVRVIENGSFNLKNTLILILLGTLWSTLCRIIERNK